MKTHLRIVGVDCTDLGQTWSEYTHQTACGYVRDKVTFNIKDVDCKLCIREIKKGEKKK